MMGKINKIIKNLGRIISKNSPHILTGFGCAGLISTAILTGKASPKARDIIDAESGYNHAGVFEGPNNWEKIKLTWKCYIPASIVGGTSIACIIGANTVNTKRNAALAALYSMSDTAFREYKSKVVEQLGKGKDIAIKDEIAKETIAKNPPVIDNIIITGDGNVLCLDMLSGRYFKSNYEVIRQKINNLNYKLMSEMWLDLNELYLELGLEPIKLGRESGFDLDMGQIEPYYSTHMDSHGNPCLVIDIDVYPKYPKYTKMR